MCRKITFECCRLAGEREVVSDRSVSQQLFSPLTPLWVVLKSGSLFSSDLFSVVGCCCRSSGIFSSFVIRLDDYPSSRTGKQDHYSLKNPFQRSKQLTWPPLICKLYPTYNPPCEYSHKKATIKEMECLSIIADVNRQRWEPSSFLEQAAAGIKSGLRPKCPPIRFQRQNRQQRNNPCLDPFLSPKYN